MKFIKHVFLVCFFLLLASCKRDITEIFPQYKIITNFSKKIKPQTGLVLYSYGINNDIPERYKHNKKNGAVSFSASYYLYKTQRESFSIEAARCLLVSVVESFLEEINSNPKIRPDLDIYPFNSDLINIDIYFVDENKVNLGHGVAEVRFSKGKIKYDGFRIDEYSPDWHVKAKYFPILRESYAEAFELVKKQGCLRQL